MYQQDNINIQKRALIVKRLLFWYNMYRFRESHPVIQIDNAIIVTASIDCLDLRIERWILSIFFIFKWLVS